MTAPNNNIGVTRSAPLRRKAAAWRRRTTVTPGDPVSYLERKEECASSQSPNRHHLIPTSMQSLNKLIVIGHVAADPEQTQTQTGRTRVTFPLATHRDTTSDGVKKEVTDYHRVVAWDELGAACAMFLRRGRGVYVEGSLLNRAYEGVGGERRYITEIRADEVNMLTWKQNSGIENLTIDPFSPVEVEQVKRPGKRSKVSTPSDGKD